MISRADKVPSARRGRLLAFPPAGPGFQVAEEGARTRKVRAWVTG